MAGAIANLLEDFSPIQRGEDLRIGILRAVKTTAQPEAAPPAPPVDRQAELIRSIEARVRAEEQEAARKQFEEAIAAEKARHDDELKAQRLVWVEQEAAQLSTQIGEAVGRIEAILSERVANILKPFVSEAFRQRSITEFQEVLATILLSGEAGPMRIVGPQDVVLALKKNLGPRGEVIEFIPGEHVEVSVTARDTTVQTRLRPWADQLEQALKERL